MSQRLIRRLQQRRAREVDLLGISNFDAALRCVLVFPNTYEVGMSNLGLHAIYRHFNMLPSVSCERAFMPDPHDFREHRRTHSQLRTIETQTPLSEFDLVAFSISFERDYTNVVRTIELAGIPPLAAERNDFHPIVLAGGPAMTFNPAPLADFIDAFAIGEGEPLCPGIADALLDSWAGHSPRGRRDYRDAALDALAEIPGIYVPVRHEYEQEQRVVRRLLSDVKGAAESVVLTPDTEFADTFLIEVERGCGRACRFCVSGHITRPPRFRQMEDVLAQIHQVKPHTRRVGLVGAAVGEQPELAELIEALGVDGFSVSVSSVRVDRMDGRLAQALARAGCRTVTLAPEAGTQRLRNVTNKGISEEQIFQAVGYLEAAGVQQVKLYFLYGLPTETDDDVLAIADLCGRLHAMAPHVRIELSVNPFVPKPLTPWQWEPMCNLKMLEGRRQLLLGSLPPNLRSSTSIEGAKQAAIQALLARGGRELGAVLLELAATGESRSDWQAAVEQAGINLESQVFEHRNPEGMLPWDFIDAGASKQVLLAEREKSLQGETTPECQMGRCSRCDGCELLEKESAWAARRP